MAVWLYSYRLMILCCFSSLGWSSSLCHLPAKFQLHLFLDTTNRGIPPSKPKGHLWALQLRSDFGHKGLQPHLARLEHPGRRISSQGRWSYQNSNRQGRNRRSTKHMSACDCLWLEWKDSKLWLYMVNFSIFSFVDIWVFPKIVVPPNHPF